MFDTARQQLSETIVTGDPPAVIDVKVTDAGPWLQGEAHAVLWLYAWSLASGRRRPRRLRWSGGA